MASTTQLARAQRLQALFLKLHATMSAEGERNWIGGTAHVLAVLSEAVESPNLIADRIAEARGFYRSMAKAKSGFSDFHVWRDNFDERLKENQALESIKASIWQEFESHA